MNTWEALSTCSRALSKEGENGCGGTWGPDTVQCQSGPSGQTHGWEPYLANAHDHSVTPGADGQALRLDVQFHDALSAVERRTH